MLKWALGESAGAIVYDEVARLLHCGRLRQRGSAKENGGGAGRTSGVKRLWSKVCGDGEADLGTGMRRLLRFEAVLDHLRGAPWARVRFAPNDQMIRRLTATHLKLIVGERAYESERGQLLEYLDNTEDASMHNTSNIVWVTNRQQGKTTTLGIFGAALLCTAVLGGTLLCVYSTTLDRAQEVVKAAKQYMYWLKANRMPKIAVAPKVVTDNARTLVVQTPDGVVNHMIARPKNADSCRGDAPKAAFLDEFGFMSPDFWYKFALPLLQISGRVFTCTTTPPDPDSPFASFIRGVQRSNEGKGEYFFRYINHSLMCTECEEAADGPACVHRLHLIPGWKSIMVFTQLSRLVPKGRRGDFNAEILGAPRAESGCYFPAAALDFTFGVGRRYRSVPPASAVFIGIDPASHGKSSMGLSAVMDLRDGRVLLLGVASVCVQRCEIREVAMVVQTFVRRVVDLVGGSVPLCFIIECNNNEVVAASLNAACRNATLNPVMNPWTRENFRTDITPDVGVWTTHNNKMAMVGEMLGLLLDNRLLVSAVGVTVSEQVFNSRAKPTTFDGAVENLVMEAKDVADDGKGISGKKNGGKDDAIISLCMAVWWKQVVRHRAAVGGHIEVGD